MAHVLGLATEQGEVLHANYPQVGDTGSQSRALSVVPLWQVDWEAA